MLTVGGRTETGAPPAGAPKQFLIYNRRGRSALLLTAASAHRSDSGQATRFWPIWFVQPREPV